ncbi:Aminopeptidase N [BD1-7 clade bacterium]|uniref:Aminopeptidase N n=1 Tax=BD1-7 clade bacterium TaxID=2029982 RepID=A0A5S9PX18_9GAMM|nr:Aminopeptidase N [BD1-7 clade bacterium]
MIDSPAKEIFAKDYRAPDFHIEKTELRFELAGDATRVTSRLTIARSATGEKRPLVLNGQDQSLVQVSVDDVILGSDAYSVDDDFLTIHQVPDAFVLECVTDIEPEKNTSLEGLYRSNGMYCTQCEAEGFRKITYYLDRPDVLSEFVTHIWASEGQFPVMLSNGNCTRDVVEDGVRKVTWHDPFKKPCYLFALVAGDLESVDDSFVTESGREVALQIFVESKDLDKCDHAMQSLKNAMRWDEQVYGREYDLDIYMVVAVDDFNMGAMENKGLNIFNTSCVLAHPKTTTDLGFQRVEAVVAHEYFHNWSGNRVTCRDWFQLSLKEGFTVYRDAEFSADMNSRTVKRVEDASLLRTVQFAEDAGPMAHPVRPDSFIEISNFYTVTIYEKGAEVVRMMANLLGESLFRKATDLYFERFDGQAVTCEDFVRCMEEVSGRDLTQFRHWYSQAGTPALRVAGQYDAESARYTLSVEQTTPPTPGQDEKPAFHIPFSVALVGQDGPLSCVLQQSGQEASEFVLDITESKQTFEFEGVPEAPIPSLLRGFSAPVNMSFDYSDTELAQLIRADDDGFARWDAVQTLAMRALADGSGDQSGLLEEAFRSLLKSAENGGADMAMLAMLLTLPNEMYISDVLLDLDPVEIHKRRKGLKALLGSRLREQWLACYRKFHSTGDDIDGSAMAARSLKNIALEYLMSADSSSAQVLAREQFEKSLTMTDVSAALRVLENLADDRNLAERVLADFYQQWKGESLVVNAWLAAQATSARDGVLDRVKGLMDHEAFDITNPNKVRSLIGAFCNQNPSQFHASDGSGYAFLADRVIELDKLNPQIASRLLTPLTRWKKRDQSRQELMKAELGRIKAEDLSSDVYEIVAKSLAVA